MKQSTFGAGMLAVAALTAAGTALAYTYSGKVTIAQSSDVTTAANSGSVVIGNSSGKQIGFDDNEIQARGDGGGVSSLFLQAEGGELHIGPEATRITISPREIAAANTHLEFLIDGETGFYMYRPDADDLYLMLMGTRVEVRSPMVVMDGLHFVSTGSGDACFSSGWLVPCQSSARYKTDILDLTPGLATVLAMRPVSFRYKESGLPSMGFVAEEAAGHLPELVTRTEGGTIQGFDYKGYTAVLTRAVQEQQRMLDDLDARLQAERTARATLAEQLGAQDRELAATRQELARLSADVAALTTKLAR
jgi:hypothetical protein